MEHSYRVGVRWTGDTSAGRRFDRTHTVSAEHHPDIAGTADPVLFGDHGGWNPEQLLLAALAQCHLLSYLALCARDGIAVLDYRDAAQGTLVRTGWTGRFREVTLRPEVTVADAGTVPLALALHDEAHRVCFIANSVNFPVRHLPVVRLGSDHGTR